MPKSTAYRTFFLLLIIASSTLAVCTEQAKRSRVDAQEYAGGGDIDEGKIVVEAKPSKVFVKDPVSFVATVTHPTGEDSEGNPAQSDSTVDFFLTDNSGLTDEQMLDRDIGGDNKAASSWTPSYGDYDKTFTIKASVEGDYSPNSDTDTFQVVLGTLTLEADPDTVCFGEGTELTATSSGGPYVDGHDIHFLVPSGPDGQPINSWGHFKTTDEEGKAVLAKDKLDSLLSQEGTFEFRVDHVKHESGSTEVEVIDFSKTEVHAKRTSVPTESLYPVKEDEHFEVGGTFEFKLEGPDDYSDLPVAWIVQELDLINETLDSGAGETGSYTFQSGKDVGRVNVQFFVDRNGNEEIDSGECVKNSPEFEVKELTTHDLDVEYSDALGNLNAGNIQNIFTGNAEFALRKDSADDWRACIEMRVASVTSFTPSGDRPDPVLGDEAEKKHLSTGKAVLVDDLGGTPLYRGVGNLESPGFIIDWTDKASDTIVHEFGHNMGLEHAGHAATQIMAGGSIRNTSPPDGELKSSDASSFE